MLRDNFLGRFRDAFLVPDISTRAPIKNTFRILANILLALCLRLYRRQLRNPPYILVILQRSLVVARSSEDFSEQHYGHLSLRRLALLLERV